MTYLTEQGVCWFPDVVDINFIFYPSVISDQSIEILKWRKNIKILNETTNINVKMQGDNWIKMLWNL